MITCKCEQCGDEFPINETLRVEERTLCDACCDKVLAQEHAPRKNLERQADPTVCANCRKDNGTAVLPLLAGLPVCGTCEAFFRHRPFPAWIKLALAAVLALVAVSLAWNARFFRAYMAMRRFPKYVAQGQIQAGAAEIAAAADCVPESKDLRALAAYLQGIVLLNRDKSAEALEKLLSCKDRLPPECNVDTLILRARMGVAFDSKDYDGFLSIAQAFDHKLPTEYISKATLASAWACKYAVTGNAAFREQALNNLQQAKEMAKEDPAFKEYEDRIRHRLDSREIVTRHEFYKRFPNGWNGQKEE
jgi:hypothetical protein